MGTWGLRGGSSGGTKTTLVWDFDNGATATNTSVAPGGRIDINGNYPVKISGISLSGDNIDYIGGNGMYNSSSNFDFTVTAGNTGGQNRYLRVNIAGSGTINTYTGGGSYYQTSWSRSFTGTFNFEFVNTAPTANSVSRNVQSVTVSASGAGGSDAGGPSSYTVQYNDNAGSGWTGNATSPATWTGLTRGRTYSFRSWATNGVGSSQIYTGGSVYIPNLPSAPTGVTAVTSTTQSGAIDVTWTKPPSDSTITQYDIYRDSPSGSQYFVGSTTGQNSTSITDSGLTPRSQHTYYVYAYSEMGWSSVSTASGSAYASSIPSAPSTIAGPYEIPSLKVGRNVTVNISRDSLGYGNDVTGYFIQFSTDNGSTWHGWNNSTKTIITNGENEVTSTSFSYQLLTPALTYKWRVYAKNTLGTGDLTRVTPVGVFVSAGGRRWTGTSYSPTEHAKRWTGTGWVDITFAKRWTGSGWTDLT